MTSSKVVEASTIKGWLHDMGCSPTVIKVNPNADWEFDCVYPTNTAHHVIVVSPKDRPKAVMVATETKLSPEHVAAFGDLEDDAKADFMRDLQGALNRDYVEYGLQVGTGTACPSGFQVSATRYVDGLTLDSFARTVSSVYKAELQGIMCVQRHLNSGSPGGAGGHFEFKRMGGIQ